MAGSYAPIITVSPTPFIAVTTNDLTPYAEIQETQGTINYEAESLYLQANSIAQINEPLDVEMYDSNGKLDKTKRINVADPNQFQTSKDIDLKDNPIIFNGRSRLNLNLLPNENIRLYFQTQQTEPSDFLEGAKTFFSEDFMDTYGFFNDYDDEVREEIKIMKNGMNGNRTK
tara:strand:- start:569 stop:1084 length:516 start_codon:yes stop_codon:yes gene_type:complete